MNTLIQNGRLLDPTNDVDRQADLYISDGVIVAINQTPANFKADQTIDASNHLVCPGIIDMRVRLREPGQEYKATIRSETYAAAKAGTTTVCIPPDTNPTIDTPAMAQFIDEQANINQTAFIYPLGALTVGLESGALTDMAALAEAGCVGISNALSPVKDSLVMRRAMQYAKTFDLTIFLHAQDPWLQGNGSVHEGSVSTRLGLPAIPEAAEIVGVARDLALIETTGATAHFCNLSSARAVEMIAEAQENGLPVTADVAIHHLLLTDESVGSFNSLYNVSPPLRTETDKLALIEAVNSNVVSAICSDHQPHEADAKLLPFAEAEPGISGIETLLPLGLKLVQEGKIELSDLIERLTAGPAQVLGIDAGQLSVGSSADVCIIDPNKEWTLEAPAMLSAGKNNPFIGTSFTGKAVKTLISGNLID
jgi:dihydroorotase